MSKGWLNFVKGETGASRSEAVDAGHTARDDMQSSGWMPERASNKGADSPSSSDLSARAETTSYNSDRVSTWDKFWGSGKEP